jgi:phage-related protein
MEKNWRFIVRMLAGSMLVAALTAVSVPTYAASGPAAPQGAQNTLRDPDLDALDTFLDSTPEVSKDVHQNPALLNDPNYLSSHQGLEKFLQEHPRVREQARRNPGAVLRQEQRWDNRGGDISRWQVQVLDKFLDEHPQIDRDLHKNPRLASDDAYVARHPQLKDFLREHPGVRESISEHPELVMNRERHYERGETKK